MIQSTPRQIAVRTSGAHPTLALAASELRAYLTRILTDATVLDEGESAAGAAVIDLALPTDLPAGALRPPEVADPALDDAIAVDVQAGSGQISGQNPRAVLLGVYRFLREIGCDWVRPGPTGERLPRLSLADLTARLAEAPSYRHRAVCIEGAVSYRNVAEMIAWAPKVGFNGYFFQFRESFIFFERWYRHVNNPLLPPEPLSVEQTGEFVGALREEVARRGLLLHAVGHGWTCEPLGIRGLGWTPEEVDLPAETRALLAEVNGERAIWRGVPLNTNLCYSNPRVRTMMAESIADYASANPQVDLLHIWLADGSNNHCECPNCHGTRPADHYVMILNEADDLLTRRGLATRLVFLIYVDLLWPPERERLHNPDRFVLMFAPITRSYTEPFSADGGDAALPPFALNRLTFPADPAANVAFLRAWQEQFQGDSFDFDYHLWRAHFMDPGHLAISAVLGEDLRRLQDLGLNGYVSCQVDRAFFPTGLPMQVMGLRLWDRDADLDALTARFMRASYGEDAPVAHAYLADCSRLYASLGPWRALGEDPAAVPGALETLQALEGVIERARPAIAGHLAPACADGAPGADDLCVAESWQHLYHHTALNALLVEALRARATGDADGAADALGRLVALAQRLEDALQGVLDVWAYVEVLRRTLG